MTTLRCDPLAPDPGMFADLCASLRAHAFAVVPNLVPDALLHALADDCAAADRAGRLRVAGTGRAEDRHADAMLRGDSILWLERGPPESPQSGFLDQMDALRIALNRELMLGLNDLEAHYACYPAGTGYARHRDRFRDDEARVLSLVVYLNDRWRADDGGELRLHLSDGAFDVLPRLGTSVLFLSAEIEHEVLPARCTRLSIAGWFRRRGGSSLP